MPLTNLGSFLFAGAVYKWATSAVLKTSFNQVITGFGTTFGVGYAGT